MASTYQPPVKTTVYNSATVGQWDDYTTLKAYARPFAGMLLGTSVLITTSRMQSGPVSYPNSQRRAVEAAIVMEQIYPVCELVASTHAQPQGERRTILSNHETELHDFAPSQGSVMNSSSTCLEPSVNIGCFTE